MADVGGPYLDRSRQEQLLRQARAGAPSARERAISTLLADFRAPAMAVILRTLAAHGVGPEGAGDVLQEATVKFLTRGLEDFRGDAAPRTYFCRIAINAALDACRTVGRERSLDPDAQPTTTAAVLGTHSGGPEAALLHKERARRLVRCLQRLEERYSRAVDLFYLSEAGDAATCAEMIGITVQAFWQRLCRARAALAHCMRVGSPAGLGLHRD